MEWAMRLEPLRWLSNLRIPGLPGATPSVPVVRLAGVIAGGGTLWRGPLLNLAALADPLDHAFGLRGAKAVALAINCPGGSPVQAALIAGRIRQLAEEKKLPVYAFVEDVAASGGYWLAAAADEIYADANSVIGSIGVISAGFGFTKLLETIGVERRLHTQGDKKSLLDPFLPERPEDVARLDRTMGDIHESFKAAVRVRRNGKLAQPEDPDLFSGEFWTGRRAQELGLVDGLGDLRTVMRARFGKKVRLRPIAGPRGWLRRRLGFGAPADASLEWHGAAGLPAADWPAAVLAAIEERALWARYGL